MDIAFRSDEQSEQFSAASPPTPAVQESTETDPTGPPGERDKDNIREQVKSTSTVITVCLVNNVQCPAKLRTSG